MIGTIHRNHIRIGIRLDDEDGLEFIYITRMINKTSFISLCCCINNILVIQSEEITGLGAFGLQTTTYFLSFQKIHFFTNIRNFTTN